MILVAPISVRQLPPAENCYNTSVPTMHCRHPTVLCIVLNTQGSCSTLTFLLIINYDSSSTKMIMRMAICERKKKTQHAQIKNLTVTLA